jgi:hypothetical protein
MKTVLGFVIGILTLSQLAMAAPPVCDKGFYDEYVSLIGPQANRFFSDYIIQGFMTAYKKAGQTITPDQVEFDRNFQFVLWDKVKISPEGKMEFSYKFTTPPTVTVLGKQYIRNNWGGDESIVEYPKNAIPIYDSLGNIQSYRCSTSDVAALFYLYYLNPETKQAVVGTNFYGEDVGPGESPYMVFRYEKLFPKESGL